MPGKDLHHPPTINPPKGSLIKGGETLQRLALVSKKRLPVLYTENVEDGFSAGKLYLGQPRIRKIKPETDRNLLIKVIYNTNGIYFCAGCDWRVGIYRSIQ